MRFIIVGIYHFVATLVLGTVLDAPFTVWQYAALGLCAGLFSKFGFDAARRMPSRRILAAAFRQLGPYFFWWAVLVFLSPDRFTVLDSVSFVIVSTLSFTQGFSSCRKEQASKTR